MKNKSGKLCYTDCSPVQLIFEQRFDKQAQTRRKLHTKKGPASEFRHQDQHNRTYPRIILRSTGNAANTFRRSKGLFGCFRIFELRKSGSKKHGEGQNLTSLAQGTEQSHTPSLQNPWRDVFLAVA